MPADRRDWGERQRALRRNLRANDRLETVAQFASVPELGHLGDSKPQDPCDTLLTYEHARPTCRYFETQRALNALQGDGGVWLAGTYMDDVDSHESAIVSAVHVVERLAPDAPRLCDLGPGRASGRWTHR